MRFTVKRIFLCVPSASLQSGNRQLDSLVDYAACIVLHLVHCGIRLLILIGGYGLLCFGELLFRRLYRVVSACLLDDLFRRSFPGRLVLQRIGFLPDGFFAPGLFCFAALHISRAPAGMTAPDTRMRPCPGSTSVT